MPFSCGGQTRVGTLALCHMSLPLGLTRQSSQASHVLVPIEVIYRVTYHKDVILKAIDLHIKDTHLSLAFNHFGPYMGMEFTISFDEFGIVDEF